MKRERAVIIIPTYNESENILPLLEEIRQHAHDSTYSISILIVDDNSPDGTARLVREYQKTVPDIHLCCGKKEGLGAAYIRGMQYALEVLHADVVMEMDADFSHNPKDIPRLLHATKEGYNFVIGSRYVPGGSIPVDWGIQRKANSYFGNMAARWIGDMRTVQDCTAGFRAIHASLLKNIDLSCLHARGYVFQVVLLKKCLEKNAKIKEIPVNFIDRAYGTTKLGINDILEFIFQIWALRLSSFKVLFSFCIVGSIGVIVNLGIFQLLLCMGIKEYVASPVAVEVSIINNFILNNAFTFSNMQGTRTLIAKILRFNIASLFGLCATWSAFLLLTALMENWPPILRQGLAILPGICVNYLLYSRWVFGMFRARNFLSHTLKR